MTTQKQTSRQETTVNPQGAIQERRCSFGDNKHDVKDAQWVLVIVYTYSMYRYMIMCIVLFHQSWR